MSIIKKWSTGALGNIYPSHADRGNPNTKGLDTNGLPGIEAYIEEDEVIASSDNRPLKNLSENDGILAQNAADVASEVDHGVFKGRYEGFEIEILPADNYNDPESEDEIYINKLRIHSGSSIIDGQVTRIGSQQIIYFYRDDDSILFPNYEETGIDILIEIYDDDYYGEYRPVYSTLSEGLPEDFEEYEIKIINRDSSDPLNSDLTRIQIYDTYRDWEDIVPLKAQSTTITNEIINFENDLNFGQFSEGYWINSDGIPGTVVSDVTVQKDIVVKDKLLSANDFTLNGTTGRYEQDIITDGIFFDDITWLDNENFDKNTDIQDIFIDSDESIYFIQRSNNSKYLFRLAANSIQLEIKNIRSASDSQEFQDSINYGIRKVDNYLFIFGSNGFIKIHDLDERFQDPSILVDNFPVTTQSLHDLYVWDNQIWIAGDTSLWYTDYTTFDPVISTFTEIDLNTYVQNLSAGQVIERVNKLIKVRGNYLIDSSLQNYVDNLVINSSFEKGGVDNLPTNWNVNDDAGGSTFKIQLNGKFGNYKTELRKGVASSSCWAFQNIPIENLNVGDTYTFSIYAKTQNSGRSLTLTIKEFDSGSAQIGSTSINCDDIATIDFTRYSVTHTITNTNVASLQVLIAHSMVDAETLELDGAQLELGDVANQYVEMFEYLFIGFRKIETDKFNPPFALINITDKYEIKYEQNIYGKNLSVNDAILTQENQLLFVDDKNVYSLVFLNNEDEYDRFTITKLNVEFETNIARFETIQRFGDRTFIGGTVLNKVIKARHKEIGSHTIEFMTPNTGENLLTLLGSSTFIQNTGTDTYVIREFDRIESLYETTDGNTHEGFYKPGEQYGFKLVVDNEEVSIYITAPDNNLGPWTIEQIQIAINNYYTNNIAPEGQFVDWLPTQTINTLHPDWLNINSSSTITDGFYSFGKENITNYIRGNIHKIFVPKNNENFYIIRNNQIFRSKYDPNILKREDGSYPSILSPDYFHEWPLYNTDYNLIQYKNILNDEIDFNDDANNKNYIDLPLTSGCSLLKRSLRVKTNANTEVGFSEGIDYFVDYENGRVIRNSSKNLLLNPTFSLVSGPTPQNWSFYTDNIPADPDPSIFTRIEEPSSFSDYIGKTYLDGTATEGVIYQIKIPTLLDVGDTYTFSIYLKSYQLISSKIRLSECTSANENNFTTPLTGSEQIFSFNESTINEWERITVSHTITSASSDRIRVEIHINSTDQLLLGKAQLERNPIVTPFIEGTGNSRIDPDMHVWIDYTEYRELSSGTDYIFNTTDRKIELTSIPTENDVYALEYKYEKTFNPYVFGDALPTIAISYDARDDYFLYELEGRIFAINQMFAMLSFDVENPIIISYIYHYPRIDQLKIRNESDQYGNFLYFVKGEYHPDNPYKPNDAGTGLGRYTYSVGVDSIENNIDNDVLYEFNVFSNDYTKNDVYDRRIYIDAKDNTQFNISLLPETIAYFPFNKDFTSTNGISPLNRLSQSKIVPIIKNYTIKQNEEVGAWHDGYQTNLRNQPDMLFPGASFSIYVNPIGGNDTNSGEISTEAVKTIEQALTLVSEERPNIIITKVATIDENISIDKDFTVKIFAQTYCYFKGGLQNLSEVYIQGVWFQKAGLYPFDNLNLYYCTLDDSFINCTYPQNIICKNIETTNCHNSVIRVKDILFPSPFRHPYERFPLRDDGIIGTPESIATSDNESIAPGDSFYNPSLSAPEQPNGSYTFERCLFHDSTDYLIHYDPTPDWVSSFYFSFCTVSDNNNLFVTEKYNLTITYENSIIFNNKETRSVETKIFDSNSNISFNSCFINFGTDDPENYNFGEGLLLNRETCIGKDISADPGFIGLVGEEFDYHLKSIARGSATDSIALNIASGRDLGCYDETREQTAKNIPKQFRSYVGYINEGVQYPITLNSEKITVTLEFKPLGVVSEAGILFDTRSAIDDTDYIALIYNNNADDDHSLEQNSSNPPDDPYHFRVIVANKEKSYSIISPIDIYTDEQFQKWHRLSFTVNYENIYNTKSSFADKDTQQNIITLYHNESTSIEAFVKYDLNRYINGDLIEGRGNEGTNSWNFNNICQIITLGSGCNAANIMSGYYTELRIDNRFIDRKQFELWAVKEVQFNDPQAYVNESYLSRTFNTEYLSEYWGLKTTFDIGSRGNKFIPSSYKRIGFENGIPIWHLLKPTDNLIANSGFTGIKNAQITSGILDYETPITFNNNWTIQTIGSRNSIDNTGYTLDILQGGGSLVVNSQTEFGVALDIAFAAISGTNISYRFTDDHRVEFYTTDNGESPGTLGDAPLSVQLVMNFSTDYSKLGFGQASNTGNKNMGSWKIAGLTTSNLTDNNVYFSIDKEDNYNSSNSIIISKNTIASDTIVLYQTISITANNDYLLSFYVNHNGILDQNNIRFFIDGTSTSPFDNIYQVSNGWWKCVKKINLATSDTYHIGISIIESGNFIIDCVQLEENYFSSPYVESVDNNHGKLIINKSIISRQRGVIFFKFKPFFDFYNITKKYLFEIVSQNEIDALIANPSHDFNEDLGIRVRYYFDENKNRGIFQFDINNDSKAQWKIEVVDTYFNQWHSLGIVYDFNNNQFTYWLDNSRNQLDISLVSDYVFSDLIIGQGNAIITGRPEAIVAANIGVKDIILTNFPQSDTVLFNWINAFEFYESSSLFYSLQEQRNEITDLVVASGNLTAAAIDINNRLDEVESDISDLQNEQINTDNDITNLENFVGYASGIPGHIDHETSINNINSQISTIDSQLNDTDGIEDTLDDMQDGDTSRWTAINGNTTPQSGEIRRANLYDLRLDIDATVGDITTEINNRVLGDQQIENNLASHNAGLGASLIGLSSIIPSAPLDAGFSSTTVENAIREIAGSGRTTETVKQNADDIITLNGLISGSGTDLAYVKDGNIGVWTQAHAENDGWNIADLKSVEIDHESRISANESAISQNASDIDTEEIDRQSGDQAIRDDLAATDGLAGNGAGAIGINDADSRYAGETVEAALAEIAGSGRNTAMTVSGNYSSIGTINTTISGIQGDVSSNSDAIGELDGYINEVKDGSGGTNWDSSMNLYSFDGRLDTLESSVSTNSSNITLNSQGISNNAGDISTLEIGLANEITNRANADTAIRNDLASTTASKGASLVGVQDVADNFIATTVEGVLAELNSQIGALSGALAWQSPVATYNDLPITGNDLGDARTVQDDGDGSPAQYVCIAITGAIGDQWIKVADIDWGEASSITYDNSTSGLTATNVQAAIDELASGANDAARIEDSALVGDWTLSGGSYYYDIIHNLGTIDVVVMVIDSNNLVVGADEVERIDINTTRIWITTPENLTFTVFAVKNNYSAVFNTWTPIDDRYYIDIAHNFDSNVLTSIFDITTGNLINMDDIEMIDSNTVRVYSTDNTITINAFILNKIESSNSKDLTVWSDVGSGFYEASIGISNGFDAIYSFFDPATAMTIGIDNINIIGSTLTVRKTNTDKLRMIIIR